MRSNLYRHADAGIKRMYRYIEQCFQQKAVTAVWDELNVFRQAEELFTQIDTFVRTQFEEIAEKAYRDAEEEIIEEAPEKKSSLIGLGSLFILGVLASYSNKTRYRYDREWERKKDRLAESVMSVIQTSAQARVTNSNELREVLQRSLRLVQAQVREMADTMTDEARNEAFEQAGIERVMWNTQRDGKVCTECHERDREIYTLATIPPKHPHCRCYLTAVIREIDFDTSEDV